MLKVAVIGLGRMGMLHFLNALHMKNARVVAVADSSKKKKRVAEEHHAKFYDDYTKMIDVEDLDAVIVSLPNFLKRDSVLYAAEKGMDIFVDKPLARNMAEAEEIVQEARLRNVKLMVGVNYRYFDSVKKVKELLCEGRVGDVVIATSELIMDGPFAHSLVPKPVPEWWLDREKSGGGALLDLGYHLIDILTWLFGDLKVEFSTLGYRFSLPIEDSATLVLRSDKTGVRCIVNVGWFSRMIFPSFNFRINFHGTVGYVSTDHFAPRNLYVHAAKEGLRNLFKRTVGGEVRYLSYTYYYSSFGEILGEFIRSINEDAELPVLLEDQLTVMKIIDSVYRHSEVL